MKYLLKLFLLLMPLALFSQEYQYKIKPGEKLVDALPDTVKYASNNFVKGKVLMKSGHAGASTINYSWLLKEMLYIDEKKDTVAISDPTLFRYFVINKDTFVHDDKAKTYIRRVKSYGDFSLGELRDVKLSDIHKSGAMGFSNPTTNSDRLSVTESFTSLNQLVATEEIVMKVYFDYVLINKKGESMPSNRKNLQKLLSKNQVTALNAYLSAHKVNFNKKEDMVALLNAIAQQ